MYRQKPVHMPRQSAGGTARCGITSETFAIIPAEWVFAKRILSMFSFCGYYPRRLYFLLLIKKY